MLFKFVLQVCTITLAFSFNQILVAAQLNIEVQTTPLKQQTECLNRFILHQLDHITSVIDQPVGYYDSNGSGVAVNDLNNDGLLDVVLANLAGDNAIFWNRNAMTFKKETLPSQNPSRSVAIVDVDSDGWQDIVFTQQMSPPLYWHNEQGTGFQRQVLQGVSYIGYSMNWTDVDRDGDLDLITGSYDAEVQKISRQFSQTLGVIYYENHGDHFVATRLAHISQALALLVTDINDDGQEDIIVGNDFAIPDQYFSYIDGEWIELPPLDIMPHSTMGFDSADIDNNGRMEFYAVDMKPYSDDANMKAQWRQVQNMMSAIPIEPDDPQIMENVLYAHDTAGNLENIAVDLSLNATGWSWSAKFGDLDNDGFQDLYVVNGMISVELFPYLPNDELVEENQVYQNIAGSQFVPRSDWELNTTASGRGMSMGDLDNDGDLDIVINNLLEKAIVFENQLCTGSSIEVDMQWQDSHNTRAIGSHVVLSTSSGDYRRDIKASSGYLSGDSSRIHIGFPEDTELYRMQISWTDGEQTQLEYISPDTLITVIRN